MNSTLIPMKLRNLPPNVLTIRKALPRAVCEGIIEHFKHSEHLEEVDNGGKPTFTQLNLNVHHGDMVKPLSKYVMNVYNDYRKREAVLQKFLPTKFLLEEFRVKRYNAYSEDRFDAHIDVGGQESLPRFLSFLFYLNDDFSGGETHFIGHDSVIPEQGKVLVFPPYWTHPHAGCPVTDGKKYIMSTYLHFE